MRGRRFPVRVRGIGRGRERVGYFHGVVRERGRWRGAYDLQIRRDTHNHFVLLGQDDHLVSVKESSGVEALVRLHGLVRVAVGYLLLLRVSL